MTRLYHNGVKKSIKRLFQQVLLGGVFLTKRITCTCLYIDIAIFLSRIVIENHEILAEIMSWIFLFSCDQYSLYKPVFTRYLSYIGIPHTLKDSSFKKDFLHAILINIL